MGYRRDVDYRQSLDITSKPFQIPPRLSIRRHRSIANPQTNPIPVIVRRHLVQRLSTKDSVTIPYNIVSYVSGTGTGGQASSVSYSSVSQSSECGTGTALPSGGM